MCKHARSNVTATGKIDHQWLHFRQKSGERLPGATVFIPALNIGTTSNDFGFYSLTVPAGRDSIKLGVSYVGYATNWVWPPAGKNSSADIAMESAKVLNEVVVKGKTEESILRQTQMSAIKLSMQSVKALPAFLGETDVMKVIQLLPGVQSGGDGGSGIYVRGGGPDQNLVLLDGVPVYNVNHLFGFLSLFNADAIRDVDVFKGGFPARYGGRLSSVIVQGATP